MKNAIIAIAAAAIVGAPMLATPDFADAARPRSYGTGDICAHDQRVAANRGTAIGAVVGGIIGNRVAGRGNRTAGTVIGAGVGAVAGHEIGRQSVRCIDRPRRVTYRENCQWVEDQEGQFEVCKDRNGEWRPSGRG